LSCLRCATVEGVNEMRVALVGIMLGAFVLASCTSVEAVNDFDEQTESDFRAACVDSVSDSQLVSRVCDCVYVEIEDSLSYDELALLQAPITDTEIEEQDLTAPLAGELQEVVAGCIATEANLDS